MQLSGKKEGSYSLGFWGLSLGHWFKGLLFTVPFFLRFALISSLWIKKSSRVDFVLVDWTAA
jgi:hypothetical protein